MILTEKDHASSIEMKRGDVVTVRLKENPTTGYCWSVEVAQGLEQIGDYREAGGAIGAEGVRVFQFRATQVGSFEFRMKKLREWEGEASVIGRFNVRIIVR